MRWKTVAICDDCWYCEEGIRLPVKMINPEPDTCYMCKQETKSGIYVRREVEE